MRILFIFLLSIALFSSCQYESKQSQYDLVIYGGTSAGIVAAIQAKRMGKSVILIEPGSRIGGLTTGGLGQTDIGNKAAIGGISREFYQGIKEYYDHPENWKWQKKEDYLDGGQTKTEKEETAMWTFEPSAAISVYEDFIKKENIELVLNKKLDRADGVTKLDDKITSIKMLSGEEYHGKMFIDATYEGDLMAAADVDYAVGRESNEMYQETMNGVNTKLTDTTMTGLPARNAMNHNFVDGVDPYIVKGNAGSGLLPGINPDGPGQEGAG